MKDDIQEAYYVGLNIRSWSDLWFVVWEMWRGWRVGRGHRKGHLR